MCRPVFNPTDRDGRARSRYMSKEAVSFGRGHGWSDPAPHLPPSRQPSPHPPHLTFHPRNNSTVQLASDSPPERGTFTKGGNRVLHEHAPARSGGSGGGCE